MLVPVTVSVTLYMLFVERSSPSPLIVVYLLSDSEIYTDPTEKPFEHVLPKISKSSSNSTIGFSTASLIQKRSVARRWGPMYATTSERVYSGEHTSRINPQNDTLYPRECSK